MIEKLLDNLVLFGEVIVGLAIIVAALAQWFIGYDRAKKRRPW